MTEQEADTIAKRIINCWRGGPSLTDWKETLQPLNHGQAGTTYARLRNEREHAPTIKAFRDTYNALDTNDTSEHQCPDCADTGWIDAYYRYAHNGIPYTAATPCGRCTNGQTAASSKLWTQAPQRQPLTDTEAIRLTTALHQQHTRPKKPR